MALVRDVDKKARRLEVFSNRGGFKIGNWWKGGWEGK